jgi:hypothetical protein
MAQIQLDFGIALIRFLWILNPTKKNNEKGYNEGKRSSAVDVDYLLF